MLKNNILVLISFICATAAAQNFSVKAKLEAVDKSGFYSINITPQLSSYITGDFRDLRIADNKEKFVAYIVRTTQPVFSARNYITLPVIKNALADSGRSELILQNNDARKISVIALILKNAAVSRTATINGSDDMDHWFTIDEDIYFQKQFVTGSDKYVQTIRFPTSTYKYLKIVIENRKNNPLNIIEAGIYADAEHTATLSYITNPVPAFNQKDSSDNITYLKIRQAASCHFDRIRLFIESPHFYKRNIDIVTSESTTSFELVSGKETPFNVETCNDTSFLIKIYNGDNPALKVDSVFTEQENKQIVTYLEAGKIYYLLMHDSSAINPVYDLKQFKDSISYDIQSLNIVSFEKLNTGKPGTGILVSKNWIWPVIIAMIIILVFFTVRLTKAVNTKDT